MGTRLVATKTLVDLAESAANFTDLRGKAVPLADVKQRMGKNSLAVVVMKSDDPPLSDLILGVLRETTLILREPPAKAVAPKTEPKP